MTQVRSETAPGEATEGLVPFRGSVADTMMIDKTQAQLFSSLGRTRSLFTGIEEWPSLEEALSKRSREFLRKVGEEKWAAAGGDLAPDGTPTCLATSPMATGLVRDIAANPGGLLWTNNQGEGWAVRLVPAERGADTFFGFALGWPGTGPLASKDESTSKKRRNKRAIEMRRPLEQQAQHLRLAGRAEQLLWIIHWAILKQRQSIVLLPDILLGQAIWGGDYGVWPQDWRRDLFQTLRSLTYLRLEVLRLSDEGWRPRLGMHSVAVATVEQLWVTRPEEDYCRDCCPMGGKGPPHSHFAIQAGYGFLGAMEKFAVGENLEYRSYDFNLKRRPDSDIDDGIQEARKTGQLISVNGPAALFGRSKWAELTEAHSRILRALGREVTRPEPPGRSRRSDAAYLLKDTQVPAHTPKSRVACAMLNPKGRHVAFCGNGKRWGMGYQIVGAAGTGWLSKCGYDVPQDAGELARIIRPFLTDLSEVSEKFGLTVIGLAPNVVKWLALPEMITLAKTRGGAQQLLTIHLRVYGPEDYLQRSRQYFVEKGGFAMIPGSVEVDAEQSSESDFNDLSARIRLSGIKQVELAKRLNVSQAFVSHILNNSRPWPDSAREIAEAILRDRFDGAG